MAMRRFERPLVERAADFAPDGAHADLKDFRKHVIANAEPDALQQVLAPHGGRVAPSAIHPGGCVRNSLFWAWRIIAEKT
jgi:hypothetical protein